VIAITGAWAARLLGLARLKSAMADFWRRRSTSSTRRVRPVPRDHPRHCRRVEAGVALVEGGAVGFFATSLPLACAIQRALAEGPNLLQERSS
jgi:hypothetical protein